MLFPSFFNAGKPTYEIEQSLRFNSADSANLSRTPSSTGNRKTFTVSCWVKRAQVGATQMIWSAGTAASTNTYLYFTGSDELQLSVNTEANVILRTTQKFRDASAWYHIVCVVDTTQATTADRVKFFINGETVSSFGSASYPGQNQELQWNRDVGHRIGQRNDGTAYYINTYIAEFHNLDGTAVTDALDFGEYDESGVWRPKRYTGSYGTNGFYLKFDPTATNGIGHDHSGNGNNWTPTGFTTSGTGTDVMSDTPTTNWCTLNPINSSASISLTEGNLKFGQSSNDQVSIGTQSITSGKYYWEIDKNSGENPEIGIIPDTASVSNQSTPSATAFNQIAFITNSSNTIRNGNGGNETVSGLSAQTGAGTIGIAVDMDNHKIWWSDTAGTWFNSGDPAAGTNEAKDFTGLDCANGCMPYIYMGTGSSHTAVLNFGQRDFAYTPPTGFKSLSTKNLPAPTVKDGSEYFNTLLWSGDGASSRALTGVGFQPEMTWIKARNQGYSHQLFDAVRGAGGNSLQPNLTAAEGAEGTGNGYLSSFDSDGFTVDYGTNGFYSNRAGTTYVAWSWDAGGSGSSNTDGTITSTVSANPTAGFSIVSYTGTGANATIGHGLGVAPKMVIVKSRDTSPSNWLVYHSEANTGNPGYMYLDLNLQNQVDSGNGIWNNTRPTSTVFSVGNYVYTNKLNDDFIAYCFAEVEGYSKFGSYTGNGSSDGPFVYCGFRPAFVMTKNTVGTQDWQIRDDQRLGYNPTDRTLAPNDPRLENGAAASYEIDFLSNGFKIRGGLAAINGSGNSIVFVAFAENPFGGSGVSPATAR